MEKAFKYRIYPTIEQAHLINKTIGSSRYVYNHFLSLAKDNGYLSYPKYNKLLTALKRDNLFLKEVDKFALQSALRQLDDAYKRFFKGHNGYPQFKSKKHARNSYKTHFTNNNIEVTDNAIKLPKLGWVKSKIHRQFEGRILNVTISKTPTGKFYASVCSEVNEPKKLSANTNVIGIDLGLKSYLVSSEGDKVANPKHLAKYEKKLAKLQRRLSKKQKSSKNREKAKLKVALLYEKIANVRHDFLHKLSYKLVCENQTIVAESLRPKNMVKNKRLAKHISDAAWGTFSEFVKYKAKWYERNYITIDTFFPSSQKCSSCGEINPNVKPLHIREWICPKCLSHHDRDENAAKNIKAEGLKLTS